jgi:hypothetical protein
VRRFAAGGDGKTIEPLGLSDLDPAVGTDEVAREIPFGVLFKQEVADMGMFCARHVPRIARLFLRSI